MWDLDLTLYVEQQSYRVGMERGGTAGSTQHGRRALLPELRRNHGLGEKL